MALSHCSGVTLHSSDSGDPPFVSKVADSQPAPEYYGCGIGVKYDTSVWTGKGLTSASIAWCHIDDWYNYVLPDDSYALTMCDAGYFINAVGA